jgi:hypothetical protein
MAEFAARTTKTVKSTMTTKNTKRLQLPTQKNRHHNHQCKEMMALQTTEIPWCPVGKHAHHTLPTEAVPVPTKDRKREAAGWEFHCQGWKHDCDSSVGDGSFRSGALPENLFPKNQQGCLDAELLKKMSLTRARLAKRGHSFPLQLLGPHLALMQIRDAHAAPKSRPGGRNTGLGLALEGPAAVTLSKNLAILMQP